jgi:hypothetical protein
MPYDIDAIRKNLQKAVSGRRQDPDEFRVPKIADKGGMKYRFFILPPILKGDKIKGSVAKESWDNFFITHGEHWINGKPYPCPRVSANEECELCNTGFELLKKAKADNKPKEFSATIRNQWMPSTGYYVNIYFTNFKGNPEELRGTVKYYKAPKTILDIWIAALTRDDAGDAEDPKAHGVFFDEMKAFTFELVAVKDGQYNGYKTSNFLHNNGVAIPIVRDNDGEADMPTIKSILENRVDIASKLEKPDSFKISKLAAMILSGDDEVEANGGFDADEVNTTTKLYTEASPVAKSRTKATAEEIGKHLLPDADEEEETGIKSQPKAKSSKPAKPAAKEDDDDDVDMEDLLSQLGEED